MKASRPVGIGLTGVIVTLLAWLMPFKPSDASFIEAVKSQLSNISFFWEVPILFEERFESETDFGKYAINEMIFFCSNKMRIFINKPPMGNVAPLPGNYGNFDLRFDVYHVGEIFDSSINIQFRKHEIGFYEVQISPNVHSLLAFKCDYNDAANPVPFQESISNDKIRLGKIKTHIRLVGQHGTFIVYCQGAEVFQFIDNNPILYGSMAIGIGVPQFSGVTMDFDDIVIRAVE